MKKILIGLVVLIAIIAVAATYFVGQMDDLIADAIQTEGTAALGVAVTVDSVETKLADGTATVNGLKVANPSGYKNPHALIIKTFTAGVDYKNEVIKNISINQSTINAELIGTDSNFQAILDGMPEDEVTAEDESDDLELTIQLLELRQAVVNIDSDKLGQQSFVMDDFVMRDLTGTVDELSDTITNRLISHITDQVKSFAQVAIIALATEKAKEMVKEKIKEELGEKANEVLKDGAAEKLGEKLKGFKFKIN